MSEYVVDLAEVDRTQVAVVGGKAAHLGELSRLRGVEVPPGFCVTVAAFRQGVELRAQADTVAMPAEVAKAIVEAVGRFGGGGTVAVRSSATAEDLPGASFAGQYDSYLHVTGAEVVDRVERCWASLFSERAVAYRTRSGLDDRAVAMAVIVQRMVQARAAGVVFTAEPLSGNRTVCSIEAVAGLGESLVAGRASPDVYTVRGGELVDVLARHEPPVLDAGQAVELAALGRRIEAHFGRPQDIEWCLDDGGFSIVQSRPITTLFPVPEAGDHERRVYLSVGHQQMMTDAMKPLGLSLWQLIAFVPMYAAGGRLFVDVMPRLGSAAMREAVLEMVGRSDPLTGDALRIVLERGDLVESLPGGPAGPSGAVGAPGPAPIATDPAIVTELIERSEAAVAELRRTIAGASGAAVFDVIVEDIAAMRRLIAEPRNHQAIMAGMEATWWLNDHLEEWLGETNAADALTLSAPNNVTSEMGLALLDLADVIRGHPEVVTFLERVEDDGFIEALDGFDGGAEVRQAIGAYLDRYGMRCIGEIDITRPRWSEHPAALVPLILSNVRNVEPGAAARQFEHGLAEASAKEAELLARLRLLPDGESKAEETRRMIDRVRTFIGYREYPKYSIVCRQFVYKQALMREVERLVEAGALGAADDAFYLTFAELRESVCSGAADGGLIARRREAFRSDEKLTPPRVMTSDGEVITGRYHREGIPAGALVGLAVSGGTVEGRARVILDVAEADLQPGDILVTPFTDPSWATLFVAVAGLVTEVGGLMTHGAVVAREYGLPAVVAVEHATELIRDGQRIRVHGTDGYVEILSEE